MKMLYGGVLGIAGFNGTIRQKDLCLCSSLSIHSKKKIIATTSTLFTVVYIVWQSKDGKLDNDFKFNYSDTISAEKKRLTD